MMNDIMTLIIFALIAVLLIAYGMRCFRSFFSFKKQAKHFIKVDATLENIYSHPDVSKPDGYRYHNEYKYIYDGQEKIFKTGTDFGKHITLLYDKDNDKAYCLKEEAGDMSSGRICILLALLIIVCFIVSFFG